MQRPEAAACDRQAFAPPSVKFAGWATEGEDPSGMPDRLVVPRRATHALELAPRQTPTLAARREGGVERRRADGRVAGGSLGNPAEEDLQRAPSADGEEAPPPEFNKHPRRDP
jgi:hypothetical protein